MYSLKKCGRAKRVKRCCRLRYGWGRPRNIFALRNTYPSRSGGGIWEDLRSTGEREREREESVPSERMLYGISELPGAYLVEKASPPSSEYGSPDRRFESGTSDWPEQLAAT